MTLRSPRKAIVQAYNHLCKITPIQPCKVGEIRTSVQFIKCLATCFLNFFQVAKNELISEFKSTQILLVPEVV